MGLSRTLYTTDILLSQQICLRYILVRQGIVPCKGSVTNQQRHKSLQRLIHNPHVCSRYHPIQGT
jgi:hypothetical protein